jgi:hypothetical protein
MTNKIEIRKNVEIVQFLYNEYTGRKDHECLITNISVNRNDHSFKKINIYTINNLSEKIILANNEKTLKSLTKEQIQDVFNDKEKANSAYEQIINIYNQAKIYDVKAIDEPKIKYRTNQVYDKEFLIDAILFRNCSFTVSSNTNDFDINDTQRVSAHMYLDYHYGKLHDAYITVYNRTIGQRAQSKGNVFRIFSEKTKDILTMDEKRFDEYCKKFANQKEFKKACFNSEIFVKALKEMFFNTRKDFLVGKEFIDTKRDKYETLVKGI